ncbi:Oxygen sensor histidine kinase NreB [compost metagenome]
MVTCTTKLSYSLKGGTKMSSFRRSLGLAGFMVKNGLLTIITTLIIVFSISIMLGNQDTNWQAFITTFFFVLVITTVFFFIIYLQGRKLRSEQEQLANVFKHISDGVLVLDSSMNIKRINPAARQMLNMDDDEMSISFCNMCSNYPGLNKLCSYQDCFVSDSSQQPIELQVITPRGGAKSINASVSHYIDTMHGPLSILRIHEVEEKRQEEQHQIAKMITHSILLAQENERKLISRELHDGIGQSLYSILIQSEVLKQNMANEMTDKLDTLQDAIRNTIEDIRDLSAELRPSALDDIGLIAALRMYGQKFGIQVHFKVEEDVGRLPAALETAFYRIVQEALTNAAKYSQTDVIDVQLKLVPTLAELKVRDYGLGFVITSELRKGVGLYSMEERVKILGGSFDIQSTLGEGTSIEVQISMNEQRLGVQAEEEIY